MDTFFFVIIGIAFIKIIITSFENLYQSLTIFKIYPRKFGNEYMRNFKIC